MMFPRNNNIVPINMEHYKHRWKLQLLNYLALILQLQCPNIGNAVPMQGIVRDVPNVCYLSLQISPCHRGCLRIFNLTQVGFKHPLCCSCPLSLSTRTHSHDTRHPSNFRCCKVQSDATASVLTALKITRSFFIIINNLFIALFVGYNLFGYFTMKTCAPAQSLKCF